ncbi:MAG: dihydropteroate synthase [Muribaculaceae bacterium]|nr:dihydropteroate synthase [Muribaculaceae bacterium]
MNAFSLNIHGKVCRFDHPLIMGILNVTPDSFYAGSRTPMSHPDAIGRRVADMISQGADIIDVGGYSTRPGAPQVSAAEETDRVVAGIKAVRAISPDILVSVDTFRADVARAAVDHGADIINDVSGGLIDPGMSAAVASMQVPYIMMHMRGTPQTMTSLTDYPDGVVAGVAAELKEALDRLADAGVADIIVDPGFGFAKTVGQNYLLFDNLALLAELLGHRPMLVGISRKSMIYKPLGITPADTLAGTTALNTMALDRGAAILRVHDVAAAAQARDVWTLVQQSRHSL